MTTSDRIILIAAGFIFWILGTLVYRLRGAKLFETTTSLRWANFVATPIATAAVCLLILHKLGIPIPQWESATLLIALPGMFGEALVLARFSTYMPRMQAASAGPYASFLFALYAFVLTLAEIATLISDR